MNLVLDTLKSERSFRILGHGLGLFFTAVAAYFADGGIWAWKGALMGGALLAALEGAISLADPYERRLRTLAPAAFPFKNLPEDDRDFLQKTISGIPLKSFGRAYCVWLLVFIPLIFLANGAYAPLHFWAYIAICLGSMVSAYTQYLGNTSMVRRVLPFYYFDGDFPDELSKLLPSLRRRMLSLVAAPVMVLFPLPFMFSVEEHVIPLSIWVWLLIGAAIMILAALRVFNDIVVSPIEDLGHALGRFGEGDFSSLLDVTSGDALGVTTNRYNKTVRKIDRRFFVRENFGHMVVGEKTEQLFEGGLKLDGEEREIAVIVCRLSGENVTLKAMNKFCSTVAECVDKHHGSIDSVGDGQVTALFNAPLKIENAEGEALEAAKEIKERLDVFKAQQKMQSGLNLQVAVGFAYGKALVGLAGPSGRQRYTALGKPMEEARKNSSL